MSATEPSRSGGTPAAEAAGRTAGIRPSCTRTRRQECRRYLDAHAATGAMGTALPPLRVALFGPESTGKTSLASWLAAEFGEPWAPEYVRSFWDARGGRIEAEDLEVIARGQIEAEEAAARRARRIVFCDTELLTNVLWADLLFPGRCPPALRMEADRRCQAYALYLFCETDLPFEPDPQRCFPDEAGRARCRELWRAALDSRSLRHATISGAMNERRLQARQAVERLLSGA